MLLKTKLHRCLNAGVFRELKFEELMKKWSAQDAILQNDFDFIEPVLSTRCALLDVLERHSAGGVSRQLMTQLERFAVCAREGGRHQVAEGLLQRLRQLEVQADVTCWSWRAEEARIFWSRGEHDTAKYLLRGMCTDMEKV